MATRVVQIKTFDLPGGDVLPNTPYKITATASSFDVEGQYVPRELYGTTDSSGNASVELWCNTEAVDANYIISFGNNRGFSFRVPEGVGAVTLSALLIDQALPTSPYTTVQSLIDEALEDLVIGSGNLPAGGTVGQVLTKQSSTNYDATWQDATGGGGGEPVTWDDVTGKPSTFTPAAHTHAITDVAGLQTAIASKADINHTHAIADTTGLQAALDGKSSTSHSHTLDGLSDVTISTPTDGQVLKYSGGIWVNGADATSGGAGTDADTLDGNDSAYFLNRSNHTGTQAIASVSGLQTALDGKAGAVHTHDDRYYTESEVDTALAAKAAATHTHAIADVTNLQTTLNGKANSTHTHVIADTTGLQTALDGKAATSHTHTASQVTDFTEAVDDRVSSLLVAGSNVILTYDDAANTLTVAATGGGGGGGSAVYVQTTEPVGASDGALWIDTDDTATTATPTFASFLKWEL